MPLAYAPAPAPGYIYSAQPWTGADLVFTISADKVHVADLRYQNICFMYVCLIYPVIIAMHEGFLSDHRL